MRRLAAIVLLACSLPLLAAPKPLAPGSIEHSTALFLASLSADGKQKVTYKASALGTRFFLAEPAGVTVYAFDEATRSYVRETFVKNTTLAKAMKKYAAPAK